MKGVFCLEGLWYGDHRDKTSVFPVLDLVNRVENLPFIHHRCFTLEEFTYSITRWKQKSFHRKFPLLYLAFHGERGVIKIGKHSLTLDELAEMLEDKCNGVVIYFGSCATMNIDRRRLQGFMEKTKSVAILGYRQDVDWLTSASFDIRLLSYLICHPFDSKGVLAIKTDILKNCKSFIKELDFRMEINERIIFKRTTKK